MRDAVNRQKESRKREATEKLGGKCKHCGSCDRLEFDHIDRDNKTASIASLWRATDEAFWAEIEKCQLLCYSCHKNKTKREAMATPVKHGTISGVRRCGPPVCAECRAAVNEYKKAWREQRVGLGLVPT